MFEGIGNGGEDVRRLLHPFSGGPGEISEGCHKRAIKVLKAFIQKVDEHGLVVDVATYQRGMMW